MKQKITAILFAAALAALYCCPAAAAEMPIRITKEQVADCKSDKLVLAETDGGWELMDRENVTPMYENGTDTKLFVWTDNQYEQAKLNPDSFILGAGDQYFFLLSSEAFGTASADQCSALFTLLAEHPDLVLAVEDNGVRLMYQNPDDQKYYFVDQTEGAAPTQKQRLKAENGGIMKALLEELKNAPGKSALMKMNTDGTSYQYLTEDAARKNKCFLYTKDTVQTAGAAFYYAKEDGTIFRNVIALNQELAAFDNESGASLDVIDGKLKVTADTSPAESTTAPAATEAETTETEADGTTVPTVSTESSTSGETTTTGAEDEDDEEDDDDETDEKSGDKKNHDKLFFILTIVFMSLTLLGIITAAIQLAGK